MANIAVRFPSGELLLLPFYVTHLDSSCKAVLGYSFLSRYNPLIDWASRNITFRNTSHFDSPQTSVPSAVNTVDAKVAVPLPELSPSVSPTIQETPPGDSPRSRSRSRSRTLRAKPLSSKFPFEPIYSYPTVSQFAAQLETPEVDIALVSAAVFNRACKDAGMEPILLRAIHSEVAARAADRSSATPTVPPLHPSIPEEYAEFADVFDEIAADSLPEHRPYDLKIDLEEGASPPLGRIYPLSEKELVALKDFIDKQLATGAITPSSSPHGAPVLFVPKKDGKLRLCVDFRGLNRITKKDRYPLPLISDLLDAPKRAKIYTKLDLAHAYHLVRIAEGDEWKTTFRTRYGSYEWKVMPFGLTNAPAAFQRFVNDIFSDMLDVCVIVYLDDILIYSDTPEEHREHVKEVLRRLRKHRLYANPEKCEFNMDTVEYLGYILSPDGLTMSKEKVQTVLEWPVPRKVKDIQSFLGFANFYRRFIYNYSDIVVPMTRLTRKGAPWIWDSSCQEAFENLKIAFTSAPILAHWEPNRPLIVETDASDYAIAAILSIQYADGEIHPLAFLSRTLHAAELNYDTHDKELLAIFEAFKAWRHYLEGSGDPVDVVTDHKNLEYFSTTKVLTRRQVRWSEFLHQFNMVIRFRPGKLGEKPDSITRRWDVYPKEGDIGYAQVNPHNFRPIFTNEQLTASLRATFLEGPVLRASIIMDIEALHQAIILALPADPSSVVGLELAKDPSNERWSLGSDKLLRLDDRIYVPNHGDLRLQVLRYFHDHPLSGHFGQNRTLEAVRRQYTWPKVRDFVRDYVTSCTICGRNKPRRHRPYGLLKPLPVPVRPWHSISMDFIEQLPMSNGFTAILVVVDRSSKQAIFIPTHDTITSEQLAELFVIHVFSKHGVPNHVTSDRGSEFVSAFFRALGKALSMELHYTSGYHPEADGQTERVNQTLEQYIRIYCSYQQDDWSPLLPIAEFAYNNAPNASTGITPFFANKGYHPNITVRPEVDMKSDLARDFVVNLDELHVFLREEILLAQSHYKEQADRKRISHPEFPIGSEVFVLAKHIRSTRPTEKFSEKYLGPFKVISRPGTLSYELKLPDYLRRIHPVFHVSQLEPVTPNPFPNRTQSPPPPIEVDGEEEYNVAEILDSKLDRRYKRCPLRYYIRWAGYEGTDDEFSWVAADELHADELVPAFHARYPHKPGP
ncbi:hypothetical protein HHX47_DHR1001045 [Lentinula edodes]|nr:hypothetical protein HHX47_DHR1001045 [Lentinula edodes]